MLGAGALQNAPTFLQKDFSQLFIRKFAYPIFTNRNGYICKMPLVLCHIVDTLVKSAFCDKAMHLHVSGLPDAISTVGSLLFNSRIPPKA